MSGPRPLVTSFAVGRLRVHALEAGLQRLDGGAMFGVVPKPLWEKRIPADARNRIPLAMRCLLVEAPSALVLIDTGAGDKETDKFKDIYGLENEGDPTALEDAIRAAGHRPEDVDIVVDTHLHFDHAGGNTRRAPDAVPGEDGHSVGAVPSFPRARYVVQEKELAFARWDNPRIRASYLPANYEPVAEAGLFDLVDGEAVVTEGISVLPTPGHIPHHQSVLIESDGETAIFLGDVCPTSAHVPLPWIMGYDVEPLTTLDTKTWLWKRAVAEAWTLVFEHDPEVVRARLQGDPGRPELVDVVRVGG
ncbi:MAG: MBL fold metallo-hydrolase [Gemmatimonadota bacterium]